MKRSRSNSTTKKVPLSKKRRVITLSSPRRAKEWKWFDLVMSNTGNAVSGVIVPTLNSIPQGTDVSSRIGNKITVKSIHLKFSSFLDNTLTAGLFSGGNVRTIVYCDKQCNGAAATPGEIMATSTIVGHYNVNEEDRFVILKDTTKHIQLEAVTTANTAQSIIYQDIYIKCNIDIQYSLPNAGISFVSSNNLGVLFFSDTASINVVSGTARIRYTDD